MTIGGRIHIPQRHRRPGHGRGPTALRAVAALGTGLLALAASALPLLPTAARAATSTPSPTPFHTAQTDGQRRGIVPTLPASGPRATGAATTAAAGTNLPLTYGSSASAQGVVTGSPRVYLVFWGSQWGSVTSLLGPTALSADTKGVAPYLQNFFAGLGTNAEAWSGVATQYCQGVAVGSVACPTSAAHVGYPQGGALAGVWADVAAATPSQATWSQLAQEAVTAANHFGNTTATANRNAQYLIVSPSGTHPDGFGPTGTFCAWHGDAQTSSGLIAFTNLPYVPDVGTSCGGNAVNGGAAGALDGVSMVAGHEYAETLTDPYVGSGWTDSNGDEVADKCTWWTAGNAANLNLATGLFAVQSLWGNDLNGGAGGCELAHAVVTSAPAPTVISLLNPGSLTTVLGTAVNLTLSATDSAGLPLTYTASGLPAGLVINPTTGVISGTPTSSGTYSVTVVARDSSGTVTGTTFTLSVTAPPSPSRTGYWMLGSGGSVYAFGAAAYYGSAPVGGGQTAVAQVSTPSGNGYWIAGSAGSVYAFGDAGFFGAGPALQAGETITSMSAVPTGGGYWLFSSRGRVFPYGSAGSFGDLAGRALNGPVLGGVATPSGQGYYMVASDGGIFAYGDAHFAGSMGGQHLNSPVVGLVPSPSGNGYWLVASDGGIFAYGNSAFWGSMGGKALNKPVIGMVAYGNGYLMVASDGGIFDFSDTAFLGSLGGQALPAPIGAVTPLGG